MGEPPELWAVTVANLLALGFGGVLTTVSYLAYRSRSPSPSFRNAAIGFALVTAGGLVEPVYQFGVRRDYHLGGREMLAMQGAETALMAAGLGLLLYAVAAHGRSGTTVSARTDPDDAR